MEKHAGIGSPSVGGGQAATSKARHIQLHRCGWQAADNRATSIPQVVCHNGNEGIPGELGASQVAASDERRSTWASAGLITC